MGNKHSEDEMEYVQMIVSVEDLLVGDRLFTLDDFVMQIVSVRRGERAYSDSVAVGIMTEGAGYEANSWYPVGTLFQIRRSL